MRHIIMIFTNSTPTCCNICKVSVPFKNFATVKSVRSLLSRWVVCHNNLMLIVCKVTCLMELRTCLLWSETFAQIQPEYWNRFHYTHYINTWKCYVDVYYTFRMIWYLCEKTDWDTRQKQWTQDISSGYKKFLMADHITYIWK